MTLFANRRRTIKGPFIDTQRLLYLAAPPNKRKECLSPIRFRAGRETKKNSEESAGDELPPGCSWQTVEHREEFLLNLSRPRLCLLVDAGVGKTTAMQQALYLRSAALKGHLVLGFRFAALPDEAADYLDRGDDSWLLKRLGDLDAAPRLSAGLARSLIEARSAAGSSPCWLMPWTSAARSAEGDRTRTRWPPPWQAS